LSRKRFGSAIASWLLLILFCSWFSESPGAIGGAAALFVVSGLLGMKSLVAL